MVISMCVYVSLLNTKGEPGTIIKQVLFTHNLRPESSKPEKVATVYHR